MAFNNKNYVVTWPVTSATALYTGSLNVLYRNLSIPLVNGIPITNPRTGIIAYNYNLPANNLRHLTFNSSTAGVVFQVTGIVSIYPTYKSPTTQTSIVTETVTCTSASTTYTSANIYSQVLSIVPTTMPSTITTLSIGYSTGSTVPFFADVWKNSNNYSVAFTGVTSQSLNLQYSLDDINYFAANFPQSTVFFVSPSGFGNPVTDNGIVSFIGIPLSSMQIAASGTGAFTATIMQQGASY